MRQAPATLLVVVALVCACALSSSGTLRARRPRSRSASARIEAHLVPGIVVKGGPPQALTMDDRMRALHNGLAVSVAVLNHGAIEWARAYGLPKAEAARAGLAPRTRFQAASISNVAAMAALRLVQGGRAVAR